MLVTSENVLGLFPGHNHLLTNDPIAGLLQHMD